MTGKQQSPYKQQIEKISQFEREAKQGGTEEFFQDLLLKIDLFAREWVFFQMHGKITVEEHAELIYRKSDLTRAIKNYRRK